MNNERLKSSPDQKKDERAFQIYIEHPETKHPVHLKFTLALDKIAFDFGFSRYSSSDTNCSYILKKDNRKTAITVTEAMGRILCEQIEGGSISLTDWIRRPYVLNIYAINFGWSY